MVVKFAKVPKLDGVDQAGVYDVLSDGEKVGELWNDPGSNLTIPL